MGFVKCYDIVSAVTDGFIKSNDEVLIVDEKRKSKMLDNCKKIDKLRKDFRSPSFNVVVDKLSRNIVISIVCFDYVCVESESHEFYSLIKDAISFSVKKSDNKEALLQLDFVFAGIWKDIRKNIALECKYE